MTIRTCEFRHSYLLDNFFDPIGLWRAFQEPNFVKKYRNQDSDKPSQGDWKRFQSLFLIGIIAILTQAVLVLLQVGAGSKEEMILTPPKGTISLVDERHASFSLYDSQDMWFDHDAIGTVDICMGTTFSLNGNPALSQSEGIIHAELTYAEMQQESPFLFSIDMQSNIYTRQASIRAQLNIRGYSKKDLVFGFDLNSANETAVELFVHELHDDCVLTRRSFGQNTYLQYYASNLFMCIGGRPGYDQSTSELFNNYARPIRDKIKYNSEMNGSLTALGDRESIGNEPREHIDVAWGVKQVPKVPAGWVYFLLVLVLLCKVVVDLTLREDVNYKSGIFMQ